MNNNLPFYGNTEDVAKNIAAITDSLDKLTVSGNIRDLGNETSTNMSVIQELMAVTIDSMALDKNEINHALSTLATEAIQISNAGYFELTAELISQLQTHPLLGIIPTMNEDESGLLLEDIKENGFRENITITRNMEIVDGRARIEIYKSKNIVFAPTFTYYDGDENSILDYIMSKNLIRKHLNKGQKAVSALKLYEIIKTSNQLEMSKTMLTIESQIEDAISTKKKKNSRDQAAKCLGLSSSYIGKAAMISKYDPDSLQKVFQNEMSLEEAYRLSNIKKNKDEKTSTGKSSITTIEEYEREYEPIGTIAENTIELLITLGVKELDSQKFVLAKIGSEKQRKAEWEIKTDSEKYSIYLNDFMAVMERIAPSDFEGFSAKIKNKKVPKDSTTLAQKISWLKSLLNEDQSSNLDNCINLVDKRYGAVSGEKYLSDIIGNFIKVITEENDNE